MKHALTLSLLMLCASVALAEPPAITPQKVNALVQELLIKPLTKVESKRRRFSRAAPPPVSRQVRVTDSVAQVDARGQYFVRFAVDEKQDWDEEASWERDRFVGCVYPLARALYVRRGSDYVPAENTRGQHQAPVSDVCRPAPSAAVEIARAP
jgi:hypothetical protein